MLRTALCLQLPNTWSDVQILSSGRAGHVVSLCLVRNVPLPLPMGWIWMKLGLNLYSLLSTSWLKSWAGVLTCQNPSGSAQIQIREVCKLRKPLREWPLCVTKMVWSSTACGPNFTWGCTLCWLCVMENTPSILYAPWPETFSLETTTPTAPVQVVPLEIDAFVWILHTQANISYPFKT